MDGKLIVVSGYLASGKSTFALRLSKSLNVPYIVKDTFKSALCSGIEITNRPEGSRFSAITFDGIMYVAERMLETGTPLIIEGNFVPAGVKKTDEAGAIKSLAEKFNCRPLNFQFVGDTKILHKRFIEREKLPERGQANMIFSVPSPAEFDAWCHTLDGFELGGDTIMIDTTGFSAVDFESHIESAGRWLKNLNI